METIFAGAKNVVIGSSSLSITNNYTSGVINQNSREHGTAARTEISMENVANQSVHLHLQHIEIYSSPAGARKNEALIASEDTSDGDEGDDQPAYLNAAFSKALAMADQTENSSTLRQAANTFAQLVNGNPFMEDAEENMPSDPRTPPSSSISRRTFFTRKNSPWNNSVQNVVDSVHTMANCAASIGDNSHGMLPVLQPSSSLQSSAVKASQWALRNTPQEGRAKPRFQPSSKERSSPALLDISSSLQSASVTSGSPAPTQRDNEQITPVEDSSQALECNAALASRPPTLVEPIQIPAERMATIYPLLLPPEGRPISAHRLCSLYFKAILEAYDVPEFKAEYTYTDGRPSSVLLTFKSVYDVDRLKELWDSANREIIRAPGLARVGLYCGSTFAKLSDTSVRDSALDELSSFQFTT